MKLSEFPDNIRFKLSQDSERRFRQEIEGSGGVKNFAEGKDYSARKLYNLRNKDLYYPKNIVMDVIPENPEIQAFKGASNSGAVKNPTLPLPENDELLTRISASVRVNREGTPFYITDDLGLVDRFKQLLQQLGEVPYVFYSRGNRYELRYPSYLQRILERMEFEPDQEAWIDEEAESLEEGFSLEKDFIPFVEAGKLYSRDKALQKAIHLEDQEEISRLIEESSSAAVRISSLE